MTEINLYDIGLTESIVQEASSYGENLYLARVSVQHRDIYKVITKKGEILAKISGKFSYSAAVSVDYPVVGDWVLLDRIDDAGGDAIIHHRLNRKSCFERKAAGTGNELQKIAANIDTVFICMSLNNDYNLRRIERYLSIAWNSGATPVIVLTKADLCNDLTTKLVEIESVAIGVDVVVTSSMDDDGYSGLLRYFSTGKTVAFIGSSGVGKSTLINKLTGQNVLVTNGIREDDKGRHTTTYRQLLLIPQGGVVVDTPGMRELQIAGADLGKSFADIEALSENCCFSDCRHETEPNCAVKKAIEEGQLTIERFENYKKLQREMLFEERKATMSAAQVEKQKVVDIMGTLKGYRKIQKDNRKNKGKR